MAQRKQKNGRGKLVLIGLGIAAVVIAVIINQIKSGVPFGMREVKSFKAYGICQSVTDPACGNCPGRVENDRCFVKIGTYDTYE